MFGFLLYVCYAWDLINNKCWVVVCCFVLLQVVYARVLFKVQTSFVCGFWFTKEVCLVILMFLYSFFYVQPLEIEPKEGQVLGIWRL